MAEQSKSKNTKKDKPKKSEFPVDPKIIPNLINEKETNPNISILHHAKRITIQVKGRDEIIEYLNKYTNELRKAFADVKMPGWRCYFKVTNKRLLKKTTKKQYFSTL